MAIIKSCCFWKSLRKGCYASAIYALFYFTASCATTLSYIYEEQDYLTGKNNKLQSKSFLGQTPLTLWFTMIYCGISSLGMLASILVIIGLHKNERSFLAPFIVVASLDLIVSFIHFVLNIVLRNIKFDPLTGTIYIIDLFIHCLNMYCIVCVLSQYQEYKEYGCENHFIINHNGIKHSTTPEKSCIILHHQSNISPVNNGAATNITLLQETSHMNGSAHDLQPDVLTTIPTQNSEEEIALDKIGACTQV